MRKFFVLAALLLFVGISSADACLRVKPHKTPITSQSGVTVKVGDVVKLLLPYRDGYVSVGVNSSKPIRNPYPYIGSEYVVEGWVDYGIVYIIAHPAGGKSQLFINFEAALMSKEVEFIHKSPVSYYK